MQNWRRGDAGLPWSTAWTEYALYFLFAFHSGLYDDFHVSVPDSKQHILQDTAVWDAAGYANWDACRDTFQLGRGYLSLVQSNIGLDPDMLWQQLAACMGPDSASSNASHSRAYDPQTSLRDAGAQAMRSHPPIITDILDGSTLGMHQLESLTDSGKLPTPVGSKTILMQPHLGFVIDGAEDNSAGGIQSAAGSGASIPALLEEDAQNRARSQPAGSKPPLLLMHHKVNLRSAALRMQ